MRPKFLQPEAFPYASITIIPARVVCAWCPDFNGRQPLHRGASHGMCDACAALFDAVIDADRANGDDGIDSSREGEACSAACGHCGRCS